VLHALAPRTLFGKAALTLTIAFVYFALFTVTAVIYYIQIPVARRSADDLATFIVLAARTWVALPEQERTRFSSELFRRHGLALTTEPFILRASPTYIPYLYMLEHSLVQRTGEAVPVQASMLDGQHWYWVVLKLGDSTVRVGFPSSRIGTRVPTALVMVLLGSTVLVLLTAMILTRRIVRPLSLLSEAVGRVGKGQVPEPLPESGPEEILNLTRQFNRMALEVRELVDNRTTLLAGISHDLRTPMARMRLAVEMLHRREDRQLIQGMRRDLEEMNRLIGQALALGRDLRANRKEPWDLAALVAEVVADARRSGAVVHWQPPAVCRRHLNPLALRRLLVNLVDNALRYGAGVPVTVALECEAGQALVRIMDRGPGIPGSQREAVFRPFHRLEGSRSTDTGGSGLGLAIVRQLADANGWEVALLDRDGGGTEALVRVPGAEVAPAMEGAPG